MRKKSDLMYQNERLLEPFCIQTRLKDTDESTSTFVVRLLWGHLLWGHLKIE